MWTRAEALQPGGPGPPYLNCTKFLLYLGNTINN